MWNYYIQNIWGSKGVAIFSALDPIIGPSNFSRVDHMGG